MLFCKLLTSPMPHARVTRLDTSAAMSMPGVKAILTADEMPGAAGGRDARRGRAVDGAGRTRPDQRAALPGRADSRRRRDERARQPLKRSKQIDIEFEPLPFVVDVMESLRPNGPNARTQGNVWVRPPPHATPPAAGQRSGDAPAAAPRRLPPPAPQIQVLKWTDEDFDNAARRSDAARQVHRRVAGRQRRRRRSRKPTSSLDETFMTQSTGHQPLETRLGDGLLAERQAAISTARRRARCRPVASVARWVGIKPDQVVLISEYTGGGFGSKIPGSIIDGDPGAARRRRPTRR